ncbi:potassium/proton antiporter [Stella sp.]|uniref:potassium/proton antiporter n=1 Tax=Stella sp. TaxID=2912054 RepID=UPI0035B30362
MELIHQIIFAGALIVILSILAGRLSSRFGAPILLVFLGFGMLLGDEGPGQIQFSDPGAAYFFGSIALAIILFDGGLRTTRDSMRLAFAPAISLATLGVLVTTAITAVAVSYAMDFSALESFLVAAVVASTDAAAVFMLMHLRGLDINRRVGATLEVESGINDPMAIFLVLGATTLIDNDIAHPDAAFIVRFVWEMGAGALIGWLGGQALVLLINRLQLAAGLYPILAVAGAVFVFGTTLVLHASGFLAVFLVGYVLGNRRHRGNQLIVRFSDALGWLSQIALFVMLGLFVTPSTLLPYVWPAIGIASALLLLGRPIAVWISLWPFRFETPEKLFIAWVGLRGAVPIYLAMIPLLHEVPQAHAIFSIAFVVVIVSLVLQGWTLPVAARLTGVEVPPETAGDDRLDLDPLHRQSRELVGYRVAEGSPAVGLAPSELHLPPETSVVTVLRDDRVLRPEAGEPLAPDDLVLALGRTESLFRLDRLFAAQVRPIHREAGGLLGDFPIDPTATIGAIVDFYGLPAGIEIRSQTAEAYVANRLGRLPVAGDAVPLGAAELVVRETGAGRIERLGLRLDPEAARSPAIRLGRRVRRFAGGARRSLAAIGRRQPRP